MLNFNQNKVKFKLSIKTIITLWYCTGKFLFNSITRIPVIFSLSVIKTDNTRDLKNQNSLHNIHAKTI